MITGLPVDCRVNREEIFGPVVTITPFDREEEVLGYANDTEYGLASTVWTQNLNRAHRVAEQIHTGTVWVNCWLVRDLRVPFGGMKQSGVGREGGEEALRFFTEPKILICIAEAISPNERNIMCRNIKTLHNFAPPATEEEIRASALQFVRKLSGFTKPSQVNEQAFNHAVDEVTRVVAELAALVSHAGAAARSRGGSGEGAGARVSAKRLATALHERVFRERAGGGTGGRFSARETSRQSSFPLRASGRGCAGARKSRE